MYDLGDFEDCLSFSGISVLMQAQGFYGLKSNLSKGKYTNYPHLRDICEVKFKRGSTKMFWKNNYDDEFKNGNF